MAALQKLVVLLICINIFMYFGVNYAIADGATGEHAIKMPGDVFDLLLQDSSQLDTDMDAYSDSIGTGEEVINNNINISPSFSSMPNKEAGASVSTDVGGFAFLDIPRILWAFIATIVNLAIIPLTLFSMASIPPIIAILFGIPLSIVNFVTAMVFLRGGGAS